MTQTERAVGRPRSEEARTAVLRAVDDKLVEVGYAAMTMKGIAERAGVGRQTVYRWWTTKAEILLEASAADAAAELAVEPRATALEDVRHFLAAVVRFLTESDAGLAYRALIGEAQHDPKVAELMAGADPLGDAARVVIERDRAAPAGRRARSGGGRRRTRGAGAVPDPGAGRRDRPVRGGDARGTLRPTVSAPPAASSTDLRT